MRSHIEIYYLWPNIIFLIGPDTDSLSIYLSTKPDSIHINVTNIQYSIQRAAINLSQDLYSNKNKRNKMYDDIVIDEDNDVIDERNKLPETKIIEDIDQRKRMKMLKEYINTKMEAKRSQVIHYFMQGLSYKEISKLMDISEGNARKLRYRAFLELEEHFKNENIS